MASRNERPTISEVRTNMRFREIRMQPYGNLHMPAAWPAVWHIANAFLAVAYSLIEIFVLRE